MRAEDTKRTYFRLPVSIAPTIVSILPLQKDEQLNKLATQLNRDMSERGISAICDATGTSVGKR